MDGWIALMSIWMAYNDTPPFYSGSKKMNKILHFTKLRSHP